MRNTTLILFQTSESKLFSISSANLNRCYVRKAAAFIADGSGIKGRLLRKSKNRKVGGFCWLRYVICTMNVKNITWESKWLRNIGLICMGEGKSRSCERKRSCWWKQRVVGGRRNYQCSKRKVRWKVQIWWKWELWQLHAGESMGYMATCAVFVTHQSHVTWKECVGVDTDTTQSRNLPGQNKTTNWSQKWNFYYILVLSYHAAAKVTVTDDVTFGSRAYSVIPYFLHFPDLADFPLVFAIHPFSKSSPWNRPYLRDKFWSAVPL